MSDDFTTPALASGQLVQQVVQQAGQRASAEKTYMARQQMERDFMFKDMEINFNLAKSFMATDKTIALDYFNRGLSHIGREATMEQFDPAFTIFQDAAQLRKDGDELGFQAYMKQADTYLTNTADKARAAKMMGDSRKIQARKEADVVAALEESPRMGQAREIVNLSQMLDQDQLSDTDKMRLFGSMDPDVIAKGRAGARAMVLGDENRRELHAQLFEYQPAAFGQYGQQYGAFIGDPKKVAMARVAQLFEKGNLSQEEIDEVDAKVKVWGDDWMRNAWDANTKENAHRTLLRDIEAVGNQQAALSGNVNKYKDADVVVTQLRESTQHDPTKPLTDEQAKDQLLVEGTVAARGQLFKEQNAGTVQNLEQTAKVARSQAEQLSKRAVSALPQQKQRLNEQINEFESTAKANSAQARLLSTESPYAIAEMEAELPTMNEYDRGQAEKGIEKIKGLRDADVKVVEDEKARLMRRETLLRTQLPDADKKAEEEARMRTAQQAVIEAMNRGQNYTRAIAVAADTLGVKPSELSKEMTAYRGTGVYEANIQLAQKMTDWSRAHGGALPSHPDVVAMKLDVSKATGIDMKELAELEKDPHAIQRIENIAGTERKDISEARVKLAVLNDIEGLYQGKFVGKLDDLFAKFAGPLDLLSADELEFRSTVKKNAAELRKFYIGAAQTKPELAGIIPAVPDTDMSQSQFKAAVKAGQKFMKIYLGEHIAVPREMGMRVPSEQPAATRGQQQGPSEQPTFSRNQQEAYDRLHKSRPELSEAILREFILETTK